MKIKIILAVGSLIIFPIIGLAQTSDQRCGAFSYKFFNECGGGIHKNVYAKCFDGFDATLGDATLCQSDAILTHLADEVCTNHCPNGGVPQSSEESPITPVIPETAVPAIAPTPTPGASAPTTAATLPDTKCGVNIFKVYNECGAGVYKNVYAQCYDGFAVNLGETTSCKPADLWNQYAKEVCVSHCFSRNGSGAVLTPPQPQPTESAPVIYNTGSAVGSGNRSTPLKPLSLMPAPVKWISVCAISDSLMQNYNDSILELQKQEAKSDKIKIEDITREIGNLKKYIEAQKKACAENPQTAWQVTAPPEATEIRPVAAIENKPAEIKPVAVAIDRCNEVAQWEAKIAYYKKLNDLNDADLKKEGFSREEIEKILQELSLGIEKVSAQCSSQEKMAATPRGTAAMTGSAFIAETVKPVVAESGQEISTYYKARIEKAVSAKGEEKQIEELKTLRDEIDGLISNLIKSRKELEVSELNTLVKEVKISRGEIKADDISVKTTEKKMLVSVGDRPVSIEPAENQVIIRDKGLEVNTGEVTIKENVLSVGGVDVKMSASEVSEKLGLAPTTIELKEENTKAVYNMKINERRKLFGFIPLNVSRAVAVDAENGNMLSEQHPWYNFLTTK